MAVRWTLGCDAADPHRIAAFWVRALGYVPEPGYGDPDGTGPAIGFLRVPEGKRDEPRTDVWVPATAGMPTGRAVA
jgi:hypothetical protein